MKIKKKLVNPGKTNKLLYPVLGGVTLVFFLFILLLLRGTGGGDFSLGKEAAYLKNTPGIVELITEEESRHLIIVYDPDQKGNFNAMARFAAIRISSRGVEVAVSLAARKRDEIVYSVRASKGKLLEET